MRRIVCTLFAAALCCYLGVYNGQLALFEDANLKQVFPYSVDSYSVADQEALRRGIPYSSPLELQRLLENYLS